MSERVRVLVTPKDENPYQQLLYDAVASAGATVRFEEGPSGSQTINLLLAPLMLVRHRLGGYRLLHIHWVFRFSLPWARRSRLGRQAMQWWFMFYLWSAHVLGYRIVWTAHDLLPHEQVFADDRRGREYLIARSDAVIALSQASAAALAELGARDVRVIPFASYADPYPVTLTREEARSQLGIAENDVAVLLIGKIERYKGADLLLEAVAALSPPSPVRVLVVGACTDEAYRDALFELAGRAGPSAIVRLERIPDGEMATYLEAADFAAFPFRAVTNSSSILLAQSFGLPVLIPELSTLSDVPAETAIRYDPDRNGLVGTLEAAARMDRDLRRAMGDAARRHAHSNDWSTVGRLHLETYERLLGG